MKSQTTFSKADYFFFSDFLKTFYIGIQSISNVVLLSFRCTQSYLVTHIRVIAILFQILFPLRLLQNIERSSLCFIKSSFEKLETKMQQQKTSQLQTMIQSYNEILCSHLKMVSNTGKEGVHETVLNEKYKLEKNIIYHHSFKFFSQLSVYMHI